MVKEITPLANRYAAYPDPGSHFTSRIPVTSSSKHRFPSNSSSGSQIAQKRAVLGERSENDMAPPAITPAPSQLKPLKRSLVKSTPRPKQQQPRVHGPSPASSVTSTADETMSFSKPGSTPYPGRPSLDMATRVFRFNENETLLLNVTAPDMTTGLTSPITSDASDDEWLPSKTQPKSRRNVSARTLLPAASQEPKIRNQHSTYRLPTPPSSQNDTGLARLQGAMLKSSRVRPRPAPTPPRRLSKGPAAETLDPSPNPRRKKTLRVSDSSQLESPSRLDTTPRAAPRASQPRQPRHDVRSDLAARPATQPNPSTPFAAESSQGKARTVPSTAPPVRRQRQSLSKSTKTKPKPKTRASMPASAARKDKGRRSMTPAAITALTGKPIGFLDKEIGAEPGDDPLLLKPLDDDQNWEKKRLTKSLSSLNIRSANKPRASDISRKPKSTITLPSKLREVSAFVDTSGAPPTPTSMRSTQQTLADLEVETENSGFLYEAEQGWASDDSDDQGVDSAQGGANDTFVHITGQQGDLAELSNLSRLAPFTPPRQRTASPVLDAVQQSPPALHSPRPSSLVANVEPQRVQEELAGTLLHDALVPTPAMDSISQEPRSPSPVWRATLAQSSPARQSPIVESTTPIGSPAVRPSTPLVAPIVQSTTPLDPPPVIRAPSRSTSPTSPLQQIMVHPRSPLHQMIIPAAGSTPSSPSRSQDSEKADTTLEGVAQDWEEGDSLDVEPAVDVGMGDAEDTSLDSDTTQEAITNEWDVSMDAAAPLFAEHVSPTTSGSPPPADLIDFQRADSPDTLSSAGLYPALHSVTQEPVKAPGETGTMDPITTEKEAQKEEENLSVPEEVDDEQSEAAFESLINLPTSPEESSLEQMPALREKESAQSLMLKDLQDHKAEEDSGNEVEGDVLVDDQTVAPIAVTISPAQSISPTSPPRFDLAVTETSVSPAKVVTQALLSPFNFTGSVTAALKSPASPLRLASVPVSPHEDGPLLSVLASPFKSPEVFDFSAVTSSPTYSHASPPPSEPASPVKVLKPTSPFKFKRLDGSVAPPALDVLHSTMAPLSPARSTHSRAHFSPSPIMESMKNPAQEALAPTLFQVFQEPEREQEDATTTSTTIEQALVDKVENAREGHVLVEDAGEKIHHEEQIDDVSEGQVTLEAISENWDNSVEDESGVASDSERGKDEECIHESAIPQVSIVDEGPAEAPIEAASQSPARDEADDDGGQSAAESSVHEDHSQDVQQDQTVVEDDVVADDCSLEHSSDESILAEHTKCGKSQEEPEEIAGESLNAPTLTDSFGHDEPYEEESQEQEEEQDDQDKDQAVQEEALEAKEEEPPAETAPSNKILLSLVERGVVKVEPDEPQNQEIGKTLVRAAPSTTVAKLLAPDDLFDSVPPPPPLPLLAQQTVTANPQDVSSRQSKLEHRLPPTSHKNSGEESFSRPVLRSRRSLGDEFALATADDDEEDVGNDSFKSVVEVSSMDPRAAARAAAILKLNHAYIEHGVLPSSTPLSSTVPLPGLSTPGTPAGRTLRRHARSRSRQVESQHFASVDSARKLNREELLYEAELEIVASRRSRSRSRARSIAPSESGWESDETELALPGGWKYTPVKRKRARSIAGPLMLSQVTEHEPSAQNKGKSKAIDIIDTGRPWGVAEWKRLEKTYRAEKETWVKERAVKPLPGWISWAKRALGGAKPEATEWDTERVVKSFLKSEDAEGLGGEWAEKMIALRVKALEKRVNQPRDASRSKAKGDEEKRFSKKQKVDESARQAVVPETPGKALDADSTVISIVPPSTIRRMLGYVWTRPDVSAAIEEGDSLNDDSVILPPGGFEKKDKVENKLLARLKHGSTSFDSGSPMREVRSSTLIQHPSSPTWTAPAAPRPSHAAITASNATAHRPVPGLISSSAPSSRGLFPKLDPPMNQRSTAIKALFQPEQSSSQFASRSLAPIGIPGRGIGPRKSVSDLVKSFEDESVLSRKEHPLRKVQSRGA